MDLTLLMFAAVFAISVILILITLATLPKLGDERKKYVKLKAQSYAFTVVVGFILIKIGTNSYKSLWGDGSYDAINPFSFLLAISVVYLVSLLITKRKYGG